MFLFDCMRSGRLSWMLVQSALHHDFATTGICVVGIVSRWTLQTSLLATVICCLLLFAARWVAGRRLRNQTTTQADARGFRLTLRTGSWNLLFAIRRRTGGRYLRWYCLLRVRSLKQAPLERQNTVSQAAVGSCPGSRITTP